MRSQATRALRWTWHRLLYIALIVVNVVMLWIALALALRSGMFKPTGGTPNSDQVKIFLAFIGGAFGTSATVLIGLFTRDHNRREQRRLEAENAHEEQRLRVETLVKNLPVASPRSQLAAILSSMVLLGQHRLAIRVLEPAWDEGTVDSGTATWLIDQIIAGESTYGGLGDHADDAAIDEAAVLLAGNADRLTDTTTGRYYFPWHFVHQWNTEKELTVPTKDNLLLAMGQMLVARTRSWWCRHGDLPEWPIRVLVECATKEPDPVIRSSAAVLVSALHDCSPKQFEEHVSADRLTAILEQAAAATTQSVPAEYFTIAERIRTDWGSGLSS